MAEECYHNVQRQAVMGPVLMQVLFYTCQLKLLVLVQLNHLLKEQSHMLVAVEWRMGLTGHIVVDHVDCIFIV